jgi:parallel beta-helix repeat protein
MRKIIFLLLYCIFIKVSATNYYVSNTGNDMNDGLTEATSWRTLNKVNAIMSTLTSGDIVAFKGGDEFYGTLKIYNKNGITFTSYGLGKAEITGGKKITGWTNIGNNKWVASELIKIHQVFDNEKVLSQSRYPKIVSDYDPKSNYFQVTSNSSNTVFSCAKLIGFPNIVGSYVQIQSADWKFTSVSVKAFNSGTGQITLTKAPSHPIDIGDNFFVINHINLLDTEGEWYYDNGENKLYLSSISAPTNVIGNTLDGIGIDIDKSDFLTIENLSIKYYTQKGINAKSSNNLTVNNCEFLYCYDYGIRTKKSPNATLTNNYFKGGMMNAVTFNEWDGITYPSNSVVSKNTIFEQGMVKQATARNFDIPQTIGLHGSGDTMSYNDIQKIGYNGVRIYGANATVENNFIKDFCLTSHDGGAIYTQASSFSGTKVDGGIIRNNIILSRDFGYKWRVYGIYNDDRSKNIQVLENTIVDTNSGIFLHNTKNITVDGNNIYNTREVSLTFVEDSRGAEGEMVNNIITNNEILILKTNITPLKLRNGKWEHLDFGTFDNNKYWNPYFDKSVKLKTISTTGSNKTMLQWQNQSGQDANSNEDNLNWIPQNPETRSQIVFNKEKTQQVKNLNGTWEDLNGTQYNGSITLQPYTSKILILVEKSTGSIDVNAGEDQTICQGESTTLTASGGSNYQWSNGETTQSITISPTSTNTYTVTVSEGSASASDQVIVTVNSVTADAGQDVTINEGETVTLTASGGDSYIWNNGETTQSINVSPTNTSTFLVTVTNNGCEDTASVEVTVIPGTNPSVSADAGEDKIICKGESVTLTASGGSIYQWSNGATTQSITVSPNSTKTFIVTVFEESFSATDEVIVTVNSVTAEAGQDVTINEGESITLTASGGDSYTWSNGENTKSITVSPTKTTTYSVTVGKDECEDNDTVQVLVNQSFVSDPPPANADAGEDITICLGETVTLTGSGGSTYEWSTSEIKKIIKVNPTRTTTYTLFATRGGVTDIDKIVVTVENCSNDFDDINLSLAVYPNPNDGNFQININNIDGSINLFISDTKGSIIYSEILSGQVKNHTKEIDLSEFSKGIYFVRLLNANQNMVTKIVMI